MSIYFSFSCDFVVITGCWGGGLLERILSLRHYGDECGKSCHFFREQWLE